MFNIFDSCGSVMMLFTGCLLIFILLPNIVYFNLAQYQVGVSVGDWQMLLTLFFSMLLLKLGGMIPGMFHFSTQVVYIFMLSIWIVGTMMVQNFELDFVSKTAHFTPEGVPLWVIPLLNCVELISLLVRPLTLTMRLVMKMSAGQLMLSLMCVLVGKWFIFLLLVWFFMLFEVGVCFVQAIVYFLLVGVYSSE